MDFIKRLREEHADLAAKQQKLGDFIGTDAFTQLDTTHQHLLVAQRGAVETYKMILALRLELLAPPTEANEEPE